jgi:hypothetical protein
MTKILIFGLPRTATTAIQLTLTKLFKLVSLSEPFCGNKIDNDVYGWAATQQNCVMKLLTTNLYQKSREKIDTVKLCKQGFSNVIVTQRSNLVDCCISLYYAERIAKQYHYEKPESVEHIRFEVDISFVKPWLTEISMYYQVIDELQQNQIEFEIFDYDLYIQGKPQTISGHQIVKANNIAYVHAEIDYIALCSNYQEVKLLIEDYVKRIQR